MKDGLYAVEFQTPLGSGHGVVTLVNGDLTGGDSIMYYAGPYKLEGNAFTAKVKTGRHAYLPGWSSVFGRDQVTIDLKGTVSGETITATGSAAEAPGVTFSAKLTLIAVGA